MRRPPFLARLVCVAASLVACGGRPAPPARGVIESGVGSWSFRRYQQLLDIEVWVPDNPAVAHTASYARGEAEKRGRLSGSDVVSAVVTRYEKDSGIDRALVKFARRLAQDASYRVEETRVAGIRLFLVTGGGEAWAMWVARRHVVKIGGPGLEDVPEPVIEAYGERYPSRLESGALEGPLPPGTDEPAPVDKPFDSSDPEPEWKRGADEGKAADDDG